MKIVINRDGKCIQIKKTLRVRSVPIKRKAHILPKKPIIFNKRLLHRSINRYVNLKRRIYFEKTYKGDASLNNYTIDTGVGVIKSLDTQSLSVVVGRIISRKPNYTRIPQTRETFKVARRIEESLRRFVKDAFTEALLGIITNRLMLL